MQMLRDASLVRQYPIAAAMIFWEVITRDNQTIVFIDLPAIGGEWWERFFGMKQGEVFLRINGMDQGRVILEINDFVDRMNRKYARAYGVAHRFARFTEHPRLNH